MPTAPKITPKNFYERRIPQIFYEGDKLPNCTSPKGHNWGQVIALTGNYRWCDNCAIEVRASKRL